MSNRLQLVVEVNEAGAVASIKQINRALGSIEKVALDAARGASRGIDRIAADIRRTADAARSLTLPISAGLGAGAVGALKLAANMESAEIGFRTMLGSAQAARQFLGELQQFAAKTPFQFTELTDASTRMMALGFAAQDVIPTLRSVGDAAAALGGGKEKIDRITLALGQMRAKGKVSGEEIRQLAEAGIPAYEILAQKIGVSIPEAMKLAERGSINANAAVVALVEGMNTRFGGRMEELNKGLSGQFSNLIDNIKITGTVIGQTFLPDATRAVKKANELLEWAKQAAQEFVKLPEPIKNTAYAIGLLAIAAGPASLAVSGMASGVSALVKIAGPLAAFGPTAKTVSFAISTNMTGALVGMEAALYSILRLIPGVAVALGVWWGGNKLLEHAQGSKELNTTAEAIKKINERLRENPTFWASIGRPVPKSATDQLFAQLRARAEKPEVPKPKTPPILQEDRDKVLDAERQAHQILQQAQRQSVDGLARIGLELQDNIAKYGLTNKAIEDLREAASVQYQMELKRLSLERQANAKEKWEEQWKAEVEALERETQFREDVERHNAEIRVQLSEEANDALVRSIRMRQDYELESLRQAHDAQLRGLDAVNARTIEEKVAVEQRKLEVEIQYLERSNQLQITMLRNRTELEIQEKQRAAQIAGATEQEVAFIRFARERELNERVRQMSEDTAAAIAAARQNAAIRSAEMVRDHNQRVFDSLKQSAGNVFDALLTRSQSVFASMGNALKTAVLTAIREIVTSQIALMFMRLMGGGRAAFAGAGSSGGGLLGALDSFGLGSVPVFGSMVGGPGGTGGFAGPVGGKAGGVGGFAGMAAGAKGWLTQLGNIGYGPKGGDFGGEVAGSYRGVGGTAGGAMLAGGATLAMMGLQRGGVPGLAMTTAGGALIGAKFGGPLGAAIGAGVGAAAGLVRLFIKGATQKAREKIKAVYGIDILDRGLLQQIVETAKQSFGGNLDVAILSPQIRDLIELYAMSTGQRTSGLPATIKPLSLVQQGGSLFQQAGGGASLDRISMGAPSSAGQVVIRLDGPATTALLRGEAVQAIAQNPRAVQSANLTATRANAGRRELLSLQVNPGLLTA